MTTIKPFGIALLAVFALTACESTGSLYEWGSYEQSIERVTTPGQQFDLPAEISRLQSELSETTGKGRAVPPGFRIHLGYLLLLQGNRADADAQFNQERAIFPESAAFINGLLERLRHQTKPTGVMK